MSVIEQTTPAISRINATWSAMSAADVQRVAQEHLHSEQMIVVTVGDTAKIENDLRDKPISGSLPIARPGCAFCAKQPISYGRWSGGRFASQDRRSCCLHSGAAFHRKSVVPHSAGLAGWIIAIPLSHPKSERLTGKPELTGIGG